MPSESGSPTEPPSKLDPTMDLIWFSQHGAMSMSSSSEGVDPTMDLNSFSQHGAMSISSEGGTPTMYPNSFSQHGATSISSKGGTPTMDPFWFSQHGATSMSSEGVDSKLGTSIDQLSASNVSAEGVVLTGLYLDQGSLAPELSSGARKWTPDMYAFVLERKLQGDNRALIAKGMKEKFGVSVDFNLLHDGWETDIKKRVRDCIVNQALANATPHIVQIVQDEIKRLKAISNNPPNEAGKEYDILTSTLGYLNL